MRRPFEGNMLPFTTSVCGGRPWNLVQGGVRLKFPQSSEEDTEVVSVRSTGKKSEILVFALKDTNCRERKKHKSIVDCQCA